MKKDLVKRIGALAVISVIAMGTLTACGEKETEVERVATAAKDDTVQQTESNGNNAADAGFMQFADIFPQTEKTFFARKRALLKKDFIARLDCTYRANRICRLDCICR